MTLRELYEANIEHADLELVVSDSVANLTYEPLNYILPNEDNTFRDGDLFVLSVD